MNPQSASLPYFVNSFLIMSFLCLLSSDMVHSACSLKGPESIYVMNIFSINGGHNTDTEITENRFHSTATVSGSEGGGTGGTIITKKLRGICEEFISANLTDSAQYSKWNINIMYKNDSVSESYFCVKLYWQSDNVLQYKVSNTITDNLVNARTFCKGFDKVGAVSGAVVGFNKVRKFYNCKTIMEGVYSFTYQLHEAQKTPCDSLANKITACQRAGSQLRDNNVMDITFGQCPGIATNTFQYDTKDSYYCYGMWTDNNNNIFAAIAKDEGDTKFKYRCLLTRKDQNEREMIYRWGMTVDADCSTLKSPYYSPLRLVLTPSLDDVNQIPHLLPGCNLPKNFTGTWFYPTEYQTDVYINSTTIRMRRQLDQYHWEEVYFVCIQSRESRYLMAVVTQGKCDVDYICMHFMPRHHNLIRFRMSRPVKRMENEVREKGTRYMTDVFRESCHWNSFTLNYDNWVYEYLVLNPPVPVSCPIQGRFTFKMTGQEAEKYYFKIPGGVTPRPRMQVRCPRPYNESDLYSCQNDDKHLNLDTERCMKLDHLGRPLSEYDFPDNVLTCVGFWMEDAKSYLVTYDPDDPVVGNFRCWVYRRTGLRTFRMSRSMASKCKSRNQTSSSAYPGAGASLLLELTENERIFDYCPMRFDDGRDPYSNTYKIDVYSGARAPRIMLSKTLFICSVLFVAILRLGCFMHH